MRPTQDLELAVDPRRLGALDRIPLFQAAGARVARRSLLTVYFDTPHLRLWRHGISLRLRRAGKAWEQRIGGPATILAGSPGQEARAARVAGPLPDPDVLTGSGLDAVLGAHPAQQKLKAAFVTEYSRASRPVSPAPGVTVQVCVDRGWIRSGKRSERICEIKLRLKSGKPRDLYEFALRLREHVPFVVIGHSKAERGYRLRRFGRTAPEKAGPSPLAQKMSATDAFCAIASGCLAQFEANQIGMLHASDEEYLHQVRVAMRRLRSAIGIFKSAIPEAAWSGAAGELRRLGASLGPARDWDVFVSALLPDIMAHFRDQLGMAAFERRCAEARARAAARARRAVRSAPCQRFLLAFSASLQERPWLEGLNLVQREAGGQDVVSFAVAVLEQRYRQVRSRGRRVAKLNDAKLHRLRIAVKKLRYATDFFGPLFDKDRFRRFRAAVAGLQEVMGLINDAAVAIRIVDELKDVRGGRAVGRPRALIAGWNRHEVHRRKRELVDLWYEFRGTRVFWR